MKRNKEKEKEKYEILVERVVEKEGKRKKER